MVLEFVETRSDSLADGRSEDSLNLRISLLHSWIENGSTGVVHERVKQIPCISVFL